MIQTVTHKVQFCVVGGGLAGVCAAIAAARRGIKTLIMQERPVFGGNASSEIRMWICGTPFCQETGIIEELRLENLYRNPYANYSIWDSILYEKVKFQENLTSLLNCSCLDAQMDGDTIKSVTGWQMTTQQFHKVEAEFFADCSGDSILAPLTGAEFRIGREEATEFDESLGQEKPDRHTMGMSCLIQAREYDHPRKFIAPSWANVYPDDQSLKRGHKLDHSQNFWWMELGGDQDSIADTEEVRDELIKTAFGVWDHIKNRGEHQAEKWDIDFLGFLPGKRESRRMMGDHILCQKDVLSGGKFDDTVAYGGWPIDDHHPGGIRHTGSANRKIFPDGPYGIPLRCLYSKNISNLWFAGRNISASHVGLSSIRVMATCATMGQAVGTAVSVAAKYAVRHSREVLEHIREVQQALLDDDCFLPGFKREIPEICRNAALVSNPNAPSSVALRNGIDREYDGMTNIWRSGAGDFVEYDFGKEVELHEIRLVFDSDLHRDERITLANYPQNAPEFTMPGTLMKSFELFADGESFLKVTDNHQRLVTIPVDLKVRKLMLMLHSSWEHRTSGVFAFDAK